MKGMNLHTLIDLEKVLWQQDCSACPFKYEVSFAYREDAVNYKIHFNI